MGGELLAMGEPALRRPLGGFVVPVSFRLPLGRALWLLAGAVLVGLVVRRPDDLAWAPSHRRAAMVLLVVGVAAVYGASNVYSLDEHVVEGFLKFAPPRGARPSWLMVVAAIATAVLPLAILWWGLKSRRIVLLDTGIVLLALSLVTLRHYVHVAPLWVVLTASGALLVVLALAVERALAPPWRRALGLHRRPALLGRAPSAGAADRPGRRRLHPAGGARGAADAPGFTGRGGAFGGGGASDKF